MKNNKNSKTSVSISVMSRTKSFHKNCPSNFDPNAAGSYWEILRSKCSACKNEAKHTSPQSQTDKHKAVSPYTSISVFISMKMLYQLHNKSFFFSINKLNGIHKSTKCSVMTYTKCNFIFNITNIFNTMYTHRNSDYLSILQRL